MTEQLSRLGVYASSVLDHLRTEIVRALDALYASITVRQIAFGEVEETVQQAVHSVIDGSSAADASALTTPVTAEAASPAPATDEPARAAEVETEVTAAAPAAAAPAAAALAAAPAEPPVAAEPPVVAPASPNAPSAESLGETVHVTAEDAVDPADPINQVQFSLLQESTPPPAVPAADSEVPPSLQASVDSADADVTADDFVVVPPHTEDNAAAAAAASPQPADVLSSSLILPSISLSGQARGPATAEPAAPAAAPEDRMMALVAKLRDMGFTHSDEYLLAKLREAGGDVNLIIDQLYM